MLAKILAGVVVAFGVTGMGLYFANSKSSSSPCGSSPRQAQAFTISVPAVSDPDCCYAGSHCCSGDDCCLVKQELAAKVKVSCCEEGKCSAGESAAK